MTDSNRSSKKVVTPAPVIKNQVKSLPQPKAKIVLPVIKSNNKSKVASPAPTQNTAPFPKPVPKVKIKVVNDTRTILEKITSLTVLKELQPKNFTPKLDDGNVYVSQYVSGGLCHISLLYVLHGTLYVGHNSKPDLQSALQGAYASLTSCKNLNHDNFNLCDKLLKENKKIYFLTIEQIENLGFVLTYSDFTGSYHFNQFNRNVVVPHSSTSYSFSSLKDFALNSYMTYLSSFCF
jgi:hypothetical protein